MINKILNFLEQYLDGVEEAIKQIGKYRTISYSLNLLIERQSFNKESLRKELSLYIRRIISVNEFERLLDRGMVEYQRILYEE